ncbi:hypothetical protein AE06_03102 [Klebsiella variicola]|nr:hypothetical protein AE06_03102 [Klebsiella variicola]
MAAVVLMYKHLILIFKNASPKNQADIFLLTIFCFFNHSAFGF